MTRRRPDPDQPSLIVGRGSEFDERLKRVFGEAQAEDAARRSEREDAALALADEIAEHETKLIELLRKRDEMVHRHPQLKSVGRR
jgi:hypothetical protein